MMAASETRMPFIKNLASSDRRLRASSLDTLRRFLASHTDLSYTEALKLWQGLFYALWMSDRVLNQQALCADLGGLVAIFPTASLASSWLCAFHAVMARRWTEIDHHRMDKFMLLVRRVLGASLRRCAVKEFHDDEVGAVVGALRGHDDTADGNNGKDGGGAHAAPAPMTATGDFGKVPVGFRMHVLDIWVDECERAGLLARDADKKALGLAKRIEGLVLDVLDTVGMVQPIKLRARESLADERLWWRRQEGVNADSSGDGNGADQGHDSWDGFDD